MHAVAVGEHGTEKMVKLLHSITAIQGSVLKKLDCRIAVSKSSTTDEKTFFARLVSVIIKTCEGSFLLFCFSLATGQRRKNRFIPRQLRVKGTTAETVLQNHHDFVLYLDMFIDSAQERTMMKCFFLYSDSLFFSKVFTEGRMRGRENKLSMLMFS